MANIGVVGWGVVGQAVGGAFQEKHSVFWYDKFKPDGSSLEGLVQASDFIFICVPTPMYEDQSGQDLEMVEEVVAFIAPQIASTEKVLVIKSSIVPGTTARFQREYPHSKFCMNPEFLTEQNPAYDVLHPDRTVIGANDKDVHEVVQNLYKDILPADSKYFLVDTTTAELSKFASNASLASRVIVANEIYDLAQALHVKYDDVKEIVGSDHRLGPHYMEVTVERGFGQKCLPKDLVAMLYLGYQLGVDLLVLDAVWNKNLMIRKVYDWEDIPGAVEKKEFKALPT